MLLSIKKIFFVPFYVKFLITFENRKTGAPFADTIANSFKYQLDELTRACDPVSGRWNSSSLAHFLQN